MNKKASEKLKADLKRRIERARDNRNKEQYMMAVIDYHTYIGSSDGLAPLITQLISEDKIPPIYLRQIFNDFLFSQFLSSNTKNGQKPQYPNFYNKQIEQKYKLMEKFCEVWQIDYADFQKHPNQLFINPNARVVHPKKDDDFYHLQKLYDDIIEKLDTQETEDVQSVADVADPQYKKSIAEGVLKYTSANNLKKIQNTCQLIIDQMELQGMNRDTFRHHLKILPEHFSQLGISPAEAHQFIQVINQLAGEDVFTSENEKLAKILKASHYDQSLGTVSILNEPPIQFRLAGLAPEDVEKFIILKLCQKNLMIIEILHNILEAAVTRMAVMLLNESELKLKDGDISTLLQTKKPEEPTFPINNQNAKLSIADRKKLLLLEKLKEKWDLTPKENSEPVAIQTGLIVYQQPAGETTISQQKMAEWQRECGIDDWYELRDIFTIFKQARLIIDFRIYDDYE